MTMCCGLGYGSVESLLVDRLRNNKVNLTSVKEIKKEFFAIRSIAVSVLRYGIMVRLI